MKQLPLPVDELLIDVFYHFAHSAKCKEQYREVFGLLRRRTGEDPQTHQHMMAESRAVCQPFPAAVGGAVELLPEPRRCRETRPDEAMRRIPWEC